MLRQSSLVNVAPCSRQSMHLKLTIVLILYVSFVFETVASRDICSECPCFSRNNSVNCDDKMLTSVPNKTILEIFEHLQLENNIIVNIDVRNIQTLNYLKTLNVSYNKIMIIGKGFFQTLTSLEELDLRHNSINKIEEGSFKEIPQLKILHLNGNALLSISSKIFPHLLSLTTLNLNENHIKYYEDRAFLFLPNITSIDLSNNNEMMCRCHLPALVNYTKKAFNKRLLVRGTCHTDSGTIQDKVIRITEYSQCQNYSLFQRGLQCQSCEGTTCDDLDVMSCSGDESVCMANMSKTGVVTSCHTYKECIEIEANNRKTCKTCASCCSENLCNKHSFPERNFVFYFVYKRTLISRNLSKEILEVMKNELSGIEGLVNVAYCGFENDMEMFTIHCLKSKDNMKDKTSMKIFKTLNTSQILRKKGVPQHSMDLIHGKFCREDTIGTFKWPRTRVGTSATLRCLPNLLITRNCSLGRSAHLQTLASQDRPSLKCSPFSGVWQKPDISQCITKRLESLGNDLNERNIKNTTMELLNISKNSQNFEEKEVNLGVNLLEKLVESLSNESSDIIFNNISATINNMINAEEDVWSGAEQANKSISRTLKLIETLPEIIPLKEQQITASYSNFGFAVSKVDNDTFNGLSLSISYRDNETEHTIHNSSYENRSQQDTKMNYISLPKSLLKQLSNEQRTNVSRITFSSMRDDKLYRAVLKQTQRLNKAKTKINSRIIAASIPKISVTDLEEPVTISFIILDKNYRKPRCVYWKETPEENPHWSTTGCSITISDNDERVLCSCYHLTSFALIMDVHQNEGKILNPQYLSIISNIGCVISLVCLILTIIIHVSIKKLRKLLPSKILISLSSSLAVTNFIFLVGMQAYATKSIVMCKSVAVVLHYSLLASLMWMSVEALHIYYCVFHVFKTFETHFMKRTSIVAWGIPIIIIILTLSINKTNNYTKIAEVCWLSGKPFYGAILAPVALILLFNLAMFGFAIWKAVMMQHFSKVVSKNRKMRILGIVGLIFLLGLPWFIAALAFDKVAAVFKYIFAILNTLQGMFIFIFFCVCKKDTRDAIYQFVRDHKKKFVAKKSETYDNMGTEEGGITETNLDH